MIPTIDIEVRKSVKELTFKSIGIEDIPVLWSIFNMEASRSCDFTIGGVMIWADYFNYRYAIDDCSLYLTGVMPTTGERFYHRFDFHQRDFTDCLNEEQESHLGLRLVPRESAVENIDDICDDDLESWKEYLYDIDKFIGFPGKRMEKKRNHLNYFANHWPQYEVEIISCAHREELTKFLERFENGREEDELSRYDGEACIDVLRNYDAYPFDGILLRVDGRVVGFSIGEALGDTFFVHVEKGDIDYRGVYQMLASQMASKVAERYPDIRYLNREDDMGVEALRKSKESYHPSLYIRKRLVSSL